MSASSKDTWVGDVESNQLLLAPTCTPSLLDALDTFGHASLDRIKNLETAIFCHKLEHVPAIECG